LAPNLPAVEDLEAELGQLAEVRREPVEAQGGHGAAVTPSDTGPTDD
jgi:hypothetical protein